MGLSLHGGGMDARKAEVREGRVLAGAIVPSAAPGGRETGIAWALRGLSLAFHGGAIAAAVAVAGPQPPAVIEAYTVEIVFSDSVAGGYGEGTDMPPASSPARGPRGRPPHTVAGGTPPLSPRGPRGRPPHTVAGGTPPLSPRGLPILRTRIRRRSLTRRASCRPPDQPCPRRRPGDRAPAPGPGSRALPQESRASRNGRGKSPKHPPHLRNPPPPPPARRRPRNRRRQPPLPTLRSGQVRPSLRHSSLRPPRGPPPRPPLRVRRACPAGRRAVARSGR